MLIVEVKVKLAVAGYVKDQAKQGVFQPFFPAFQAGKPVFVKHSCHVWLIDSFWVLGFAHF
jgi:hypothetical protein